MRKHGKSRRRIFLWAIAPLLGAATACGDSDPVEPPPDPPVPGLIVVSLSTPAQDDGAALFTITGPGSSTIQTANANYNLSWRLVSSGEVRILVAGDITSGPVVTMQVGDIRRVGDYAGTMIEVADRTGALRSTVSDRTLSFTTDAPP
ncbi:MAG: hypothetical protein BMS9Abin29_0150 [Gemmatimonadota bacterium]|nr:MAG: hypothetical protein BMS9Abin29_0150 [Gemmatimonadota bacterium]